jgi:hypothetical protein
LFHICHEKKIHIFFTNILIIFLYSAVALAQPIVKSLTSIASGVSRWRDVAGNLYSDTYRTSYGYNNPDVQVTVTFEESDGTFHGQLSATHLKPNFAYQLKISGNSGTPSNELIGYAGRWWQEEYVGGQWTNGQNLNNKGNGYYPNPNDDLYIERSIITDPASSTGYHYRYTGYLVLDYFITDENGDVLLDFEANSSYHVLWNTVQSGHENHTANSGPLKSATVDPDPSQPAYDYDYEDSTMTIFGEFERLPVGEIWLAPGFYQCQIILTEESFHGWPGGDYTGQWAAAMGANIEFTVEEDDPLPVQLSSFSVESGNGCVLVRWVTESEIDHTGYELLRSSQQADGYSSISDYRNNPDLMGQGNSSIQQEYLYIDHDVLVGQSYWYYLVDVDLKGQRTYHGPLPVYVTNDKGLNQLSSNNPQELWLYPNFPNPFNSKTIINYELPARSVGGPITNYVELNIYNLFGQKIAMLVNQKQEAGVYQVEWDASGFASGVYYYQLRTDAGFIQTKKLILLR